MFCHNNKAFILCLPKACSRSRLKKCGSGSAKKKNRLRLRSRSKSGGSRRLRLRNTAFDWIWIRNSVIQSWILIRNKSFRIRNSSRYIYKDYNRIFFLLIGCLLKICFTKYLVRDFKHFSLSTRAPDLKTLLLKSIFTRYL